MSKQLLLGARTSSSAMSAQRERIVRRLTGSETTKNEDTKTAMEIVRVISSRCALIADEDVRAPSCFLQRGCITLIIAGRSTS